MTVWYVPPECLPDALLYRQHQSLHAILNGVIKGKPRRGITRYLRFGGFVVWLHFITVSEMSRRGSRHNTPIDQDWFRIPVLRRRFDYPLRPEYVARDVARIAAKVRSPDYQARMDNASAPVESAGLRLIEMQKRLVLENRLPELALSL